MSKLDVARAAILALDAYEAGGAARKAFPELAKRLRSLAEAEIAGESVAREVAVVTQDDCVVILLGLLADWRRSIRERDRPCAVGATAARPTTLCSRPLP